MFDLLNCAYATGEYRYYHFMQASDFVLKTNEEIKKFFEHNDGKEFIEFNPDWYALDEYKFLHHHYLVNNKYYRTSKILKAMSHSITRIEKFLGKKIGDEKIYSGSAMWSITDSYVRWLLDNEKQIKKGARIL